MLNENTQQFINFCVNKKSENSTERFIDRNDFEIINNADEIITKIQSNFQFQNLTPQQILKQLILKTSYSYPYTCRQLLLVYNKSYAISNAYPMWKIWKNLYKNMHKIINGNLYSVYDIYICSLNCWMDICDAVRKYNRQHRDQKITINEQDIYFSILKDFGDYDQSHYFTYRLKNVIVTSHKLFYLSSDGEKYGIFFPKLFLLYHKFFISYLTFLQKDLKLFVNIFIDILMKTLDILYKYPKRLCYDACLWPRMFDLMFSNWYLLKDKYKKYLKEHGKEIILYFIEKNIMSKSHEQENKEIFFQLIDKLN